MTEGRIIIDLHQATQRGGLFKVDLKTSLPNQLTRSFIGADLRDVVRRIPLLFSICGAAQGYCAVSAAEQALGLEPSPEASRMRALIVLAETAKETVFRVFLELAELSGRKSHLSLFAPAAGWRGQMTLAAFGNADLFGPGVEPMSDPLKIDQQVQGLQGFLEEVIFGEPLDHWQARQSDGAFWRWVEDSTSIGAQLFKAIRDREWLGLGQLPLEAEGEAIDETGPLARQSDHPLVRHMAAFWGRSAALRYVARLLEVAAIPDQMRGVICNGEAGGEQVLCQLTQRDGLSVAQLETARGKLIHEVGLELDQCASYAIVPPTEKNFHPRSSGIEGLTRLSGETPEQVEQQAAFIIRAIDPCVGFEVRVH